MSGGRCVLIVLFLETSNTASGCINTSVSIIHLCNVNYICIILSKHHAAFLRYVVHKNRDLPFVHVVEIFYNTISSCVMIYSILQGIIRYIFF